MNISYMTNELKKVSVAEALHFNVLLFIPTFFCRSFLLCSFKQLKAEVLFVLTDRKYFLFLLGDV